MPGGSRQTGIDVRKKQESNGKKEEHVRASGGQVPVKARRR